MSDQLISKVLLKHFILSNSVQKRIGTADGSLAELLLAELDTGHLSPTPPQGELREVLQKIAGMDTEEDEWDAVAKYDQVREMAKAALANDSGGWLLMNERVAQITAHRACGNQEQDPQAGKLSGYCVVCQIPWPCRYAGTPPTPKVEESE